MVRKITGPDPYTQLITELEDAAEVSEIETWLRSFYPLALVVDIMAASAVDQLVEVYTSRYDVVVQRSDGDHRYFARWIEAVLVAPYEETAQYVATRLLRKLRRWLCDDQLSLKACMGHFAEINSPTELENETRHQAEAGFRVFAFEYFVTDFVEADDFTRRGFEELLGIAPPIPGPDSKKQPWDHNGAYEFEHAVRADDEPIVGDLFRALFREPGRLQAKFEPYRKQPISRSATRNPVVVLEAALVAKWRDTDDALGYIAGATRNLTKQFRTTEAREFKKRSAAAPCSHGEIQIVEGKQVCCRCGKDAEVPFGALSATFKDRVKRNVAVRRGGAQAAAGQVLDSQEMESFYRLPRVRRVRDLNALLGCIENILGPEATEYVRLYYCQCLTRAKIATLPGWDPPKVDRNRKRVDELIDSPDYQELVKDHRTYQSDRADSFTVDEYLDARKPGQANHIIQHAPTARTFPAGPPVMPVRQMSSEEFKADLVRVDYRPFWNKSLEYKSKQLAGWRPDSSRRLNIPVDPIGTFMVNHWPEAID